MEPPWNPRGTPWAFPGTPQGDHPKQPPTHATDLIFCCNGPLGAPLRAPEACNVCGHFAVAVLFLIVLYFSSRGALAWSDPKCNRWKFNCTSRGGSGSKKGPLSGPAWACQCSQTTHLISKPRHIRTKTYIGTNTVKTNKPSKKVFAPTP